MFARLKVVVILLFIAASRSFGQDPYHYLIDRSSGLPSNSVYDIFQDKLGYIWFATDEGICRYDGAKFTVFYGEQQTSKAGSCINQDRFGRIWYSNFDGYLYYIEDGRLKTLHHQKPRGYFKYGISDRYLYLIEQKGIAVYDLRTLKLKRCIAIDDEAISSACFINGKFYVLGNLLYEIANDQIIKKYPFPNKINGNNVPPVIIQYSPKGIVFVSKNANFQHLMLPNGNLIKENRPKEINFVQNVAYTKDGLWLCSPKGTYLLDNKGIYKNYFDNYNISYVLKDNRNNYWFSTVNKGVLLVPNFTNKLIEMQSRPVRVKASGESLYISTEDDAIYEMTIDGKIQKLIYKGNSNHAINQLYLDNRSGAIIFSSSVFKVLSKNNKQFTDVNIAVKEVDKIDDSYYSFAASGSYGIFKINEKAAKSHWDKKYLIDQNAAQHFGQSTFKTNINAKSTAYHAPSQTIFYATNLGLYYVSLQTNGEIRFKGKPLYIKNLLSYEELTFALSTDGKLYQIGADQRTVPISLSDKHVIKGAHRISKSGSLMVIYAKSGLYCYNMLSKQLHKMPNAYQDFEITDVIEVNGKTIMATSRGILIENNKNNEHPIENRFVIENIWVNNKKLSREKLDDLSYQQRNIEIDYALLAYTTKEKSDVYYKLNDEKWQPLALQSGSLKLSALSPSKYKVTFKVDGVEVDQKVVFNIHKPIWLSYWFVGLMGLLAVGSGYLLFKYQIEQNNKRNQQKLDRVNLENNLHQSKLKAIKSQMNPHFFYNALNTIQSFILANDKKQAVNYLSKFANLTRTILEMSEKEEVSLAEEIRTIEFYLAIEKARFDNDFEYQLLELGISNRDEIKIPAMLLQPYVENAVKHGLLHKEGAKELKIIFENSDGELIVTIEDNGIGRKKSGELNAIKETTHKSFATEAIQSRIDLLNANKKNQIRVEYFDKISPSQQGIGTVVVIRFPLF